LKLYALGDNLAKPPKDRFHCWLISHDRDLAVPEFTFRKRTSVRQFTAASASLLFPNALAAFAPIQAEPVAGTRVGDVVSDARKGVAGWAAQLLMLVLRLGQLVVFYHLLFSFSPWNRHGPGHSIFSSTQICSSSACRLSPQIT
jgi:hypothetical protein